MPLGGETKCRYRLVVVDLYDQLSAYGCQSDRVLGFATSSNLFRPHQSKRAYGLPVAPRTYEYAYANYALHSLAMVEAAGTAPASDVFLLRPNYDHHPSLCWDLKNSRKKAPRGATLEA